MGGARQYGSVTNKRLKNGKGFVPALGSRAKLGWRA